jgi:SAM-dependent methyltransferase
MINSRTSPEGLAVDLPMEPIPNAGGDRYDPAEHRPVSERILYWLAKRFYRTELAQTAEMKSALTDPEKYAAFRESQIIRIRSAAERHQFDLAAGSLLDLGCHDGRLTHKYLSCGAQTVIGIDIDERAVAHARRTRTDRVTFLTFDGERIPLTDSSIDAIVSYDVFEHLADPVGVLLECRRVLKPGGRILIGTWGWRHPFAPHLWSVMPVPWAHLLFSDRTLLRVCRRIYHSSWYTPTMFDFDETGDRLADRFTEVSIPRDYLNRYLVRDFVRDFHASGFRYRLHLESFAHPFAKLFRPLLRMPRINEFLHGYVWAVLQKEEPGEPRN